MRHITSLIKFTILEYSPLCDICVVFGHHCVNCVDCSKVLCLNLGGVYKNTRTDEYICFGCRLQKIKTTNCSFTLQKKVS
jgi:hypothetical protein